MPLPKGSLSSASSDTVNEGSSALKHLDYDDNDAISHCSTADTVHDDESKYKSPFITVNRSQESLSDASGTGSFVPSRIFKRRWWSNMAIRARRKLGEEIEMEQDLARGLLADQLLIGHRRRKARSYWFNYCVFGGIGGLTILAFLLTVNLMLGIATLFWSEDIDHILRNWGKPGSGTEGLAWYPTDFLRDVPPIPCHSHNDYWRKVPLFSALRAGCTGVEADVWLYGGELYVGHNTASLQRNRTFQSLYVNPLVQILERQNPQTEFYNGTDHGVFDTDSGQSLTLLVDLKTGGAETWPVVLKHLEPLRERGWLSFVENGEVHRRPVTVVGTGNTPFDVLMANATYRDAFFDAPLDEMWEPRHVTPEMAGWPEFADGMPGDSPEEEGSPEETGDHAMTGDKGQGKSGVLPTDEFNETNSYYASVAFTKSVGRLWRGKLTQRHLKVIRGQIRGAHRRGLKVRYWDLPSWPLGLRNHVWDVLVREGVDMLNVDDLRAASRQVW
ncbi:hypothetical protein B7463_g8259, partial [Scytalidium lignicola]